MLRLSCKVCFTLRLVSGLSSFLDKQNRPLHQNDLMTEPSHRPASPIRSLIFEGLLALSFVSSVLLVEEAMIPEPGPYLLAFATLIPAVVLTVWFGFYLFQLQRMDELEQLLVLKSLAASCGLTLWITTVWGIVSLISAMPALPLIFIAPLAAGIYGLVRLALALLYR